MDAIFDSLQRVVTRSGRETAFYEDSVRQLNEALVARRDRLDAARGGLPPLVSALILVGSFVMLGYGMLVGSRKAWLHAVSAGAIAVLIGFSLVVLLDLSYPFSGDLAIEPDPFETGALAQR
jgi:ABC-type multidrug transport system fused ATPase/permease subunit